MHATARSRNLARTLAVVSIATMVAPGIPGVASAAPGDLAWARTYGGPAGLDDAAAAIDVSPDGSTVFVTGRSDGEGTADPTTVAYNSASGVRLWTSRLDPPGPSVGTGSTSPSVLTAPGCS